MLTLFTTLLIFSSTTLDAQENSFQEGDTTEWRQFLKGKDLDAWN